VRQGDTLKIYHTLSTGNPYAVVKMESDFTITPTRWSIAGGDQEGMFGGQ
jgi:hypothetical protein